MTRIRLCIFLLFCTITLVAQTEKEKAFMRSIEDTLRCSCSSCGGFGKPDSTDGNIVSGNQVVYNKNQQIWMRGCFKDLKLVCGIECTYDPEQKLVSVKAYRNGKLISETKMPE